MMPSDEFNCRQCGKCCKESWEITVDLNKDVLRWIQEKRFDILRHIVLSPKFILSPEHYNNEAQWIINCGHVLFGDVEHRCPFLEDVEGGNSASCRIHETRPQVCRKFPYDNEGKVRSDILDLCVGTIFFHSNAAEIRGLNFIEYMSSLDLTPVSVSESKAPKKDELREIAKFFNDKSLRVALTSKDGLSLAEALLAKNNNALKEVPY